jgi:VanZ family protein
LVAAFLVLQSASCYNRAVAKATTAGQFHIRPFISLWLPLIALMALIFILSSMPSLGSGSNDEWKLDPHSVAHVTIYLPLGFLLLRGVVSQGVSRAIWWTLVIGVLYAVSDEIHQAFVPGRTPSVLDIGMDGLGLVMGIVAWRQLARRGTPAPALAIADGDRVGRSSALRPR